MAEESIAKCIVELLGVLIAMIGIICQELFYSIVGRPRKSIQDKVVLLTGAAQGVGRLVADQLTGLGAKCVLVDVNKEKNDQAANEIKQNGGKAWSYACDISNDKQIAEMHRWIEQEVGSVDILINNAAIVNCQEFFNLEPSKIRRNFDVNTLSHFWMIRQFLPSMKNRGEGHIVAVCSIAGMLGAANLTDYCASKFAVRGLMKSLHEEIYQQNLDGKIQLTTVCPAAISTTMFQSPATRFQWALPILTPQQAADGLVNALLTNQTEVVLPKHLGILQNIFSLLPLRAVLRLNRFTKYTVSPHVDKVVANGKKTE